MFRFILTLLLLPFSAWGKQPNVLFIAVDDLRPLLGCYGDSTVKTPNFDRLASRSSVFQKAFCNIPVCGASRASIMTGLRPSAKRFLRYDTRVERDAPEATDLARHFRENGYLSLSYGKVLHHPDDRADSWSERPWRPDYPDIQGPPVNGRDYQTLENQTIIAALNKEKALPWEKGELSDDSYFDGQTTARAVQFLSNYSGEKPYFLAVGYFKPHLPFNAPAKYWDLYDPSQFQLPENYASPEDVPEEALHQWRELRTRYFGVPKKGPLPPAMARRLLHGYHACISYIDALLGRLLDSVEGQDTIIVLWGDHGFNLGEHGLWCKHSNFLTSLHVPLFISTPGQSDRRDLTGVAELVDVFPTLCDLTGTPRPSQLQGRSLLPLINGQATEVDGNAIAHWRGGITLKTPTHAYTQWEDQKGERRAEMFYSHLKDPAENWNLAPTPEAESLIPFYQTKLEE